MIAEETATSRATVWVVDDSPIDAKQAQKALSDWCSVEIFSDGSAVLEHLSSHAPPDLLVLDWMMPGVSGIDVVKFLRSEEGRMPEVPVLLLTARQEPRQIVEGLSEGANDYLAKPYAPEELQARAQALVRSSQLIGRAQAAEKAVRDLLANAPDAFFAIDPRGRITYANNEASRIAGAAADTLVGQDVKTVMPTLALDSIRRTISQSSPPVPDVTIKDRIYAPSVRIPAADPGASTTIALRDVTERRQADARRLDFYSIVAHDLRSPLTAMLIRTDLLLSGRRGPLAAAVVDDLRRFSDNIRSMVGMINDFLDLARLEDSSTKMETLEVDLGSVIATTVDDLRPLAEVGTLSLEWHPPPKAAPLKVLGDKARLGQVLANLIGNALKYTPPGGKISVTCTVGDNAVETSISDNGPGIPEEAVTSLFERFTRVASTSRTRGTGLGLMIVREIVEAHGGAVGVRTEIGKGSTFWFRLPTIQFVRPRSSD